MKETELLFDLLKKGVSPVQAVRACKERLESCLLYTSDAADEL